MIRPGEVEIESLGLTLTPNLAAAQVISRKLGGIAGALAKVSVLDIDAMVELVAAGAKITGKDRAALDEMVFDAGLSDLVAPITQYIVNIANGGKPPVDTADESADPSPV